LTQLFLGEISKRLMKELRNCLIPSSDFLYVSLLPDLAFLSYTQPWFLVLLKVPPRLNNTKIRISSSFLLLFSTSFMLVWILKSLREKNETLTEYFPHQTFAGFQGLPLLVNRVKAEVERLLSPSFLRLLAFFHPEKGFLHPTRFSPLKG